MSAASLHARPFSGVLAALLLLLLCLRLPSGAALGLWVLDLTSGFTLPNSYSVGFSQGENIVGDLGSWLDASYDTSQAGAFTLQIREVTLNGVSGGSATTFVLPPGITLSSTNYPAYCNPPAGAASFTVLLVNDVSTCAYTVSWPAGTSGALRFSSTNAFNPYAVTVLFQGFLQTTQLALPYPPIVALTFDYAFGTPGTYGWSEGSTYASQTAPLTGPFHLGLLSFNASGQFVDLTTATGPSSVGAVLPLLPAPSPAGLPAALTGFSVEVVVQWTALLASGSVFDWSNGPGNDGIALGEAADPTQAAFTTTSSSAPGQQSGVTVLSPLATNTWYHIFVTVQPSSGGASSSITAYVNGVAVSSAVEAETFDASYPASVPRAMSYLGRSAGGAFFEGLLDTLRVYSYALTPAMVQTLYSFYVNPLQAYTSPAISAVFVDYNSSFSVTESVAQLSLSSPPSNPVSAYVDNTSYSTALPGVFLFSIRALDLSGISNGLQGFDNVTLTVPSGAVLTPLSTAAACQPLAGQSRASLSLFTTASNAPPVCDFALSWSAPLSGLLQIAYALAVSQPVIDSTATQSYHDSILVSVAFTYLLVVYPTPPVGVVFVDYNSSFTVSETVAQLGVNDSPGPMYAYNDNATYSTNAPGSIVIAVIMLSPLPTLATGSLPSTYIIVPAGALLNATNISAGTSGCAVAGKAVSGGVSYLVTFTQTVCYFVVSWSAPFTGQLVAVQSNEFFVPAGLLGNTYVGTVSVAVNFTSWRSAVYVDYNSSFSVGVWLSASASTVQAYVDPTTYNTAQPGTLLFSVRSNVGDTVDSVVFGLPLGVTLTPLSSDAVVCTPAYNAALMNGAIVISGSGAPAQCDYALSWSAPVTATMVLTYLTMVSNRTGSYYGNATITVQFSSPSAAPASSGAVYTDSTGNSSPFLRSSGSFVVIPENHLSVTAGWFTFTLQWNGDGGLTQFDVQPFNGPLTISAVPGSPAACAVQGTSGIVVAFDVGAWVGQTWCTYNFSYAAGAVQQLGLIGLLQPTRQVVGLITINVSPNSVSAQSTATALTSSSSSTGVASAYSDPRFAGFWHQSFYVNGQAGRVYSLISDAELTLNAHFVELQRIRCPVIDGRPMERCFNHPGTYFGVLAINTREGDHLRVTAGEVDEGFHDVTLNDRSLLPAPAAFEVTTSSGAISVRLLSSHSLVVTAGLYQLRIDNVDLYVDVAEVVVNDWDRLINDVQPEGLLGRTWDARVGALEDEREVELYRERDNNILGCRTARDRFCARSAPAVQAG